MAAADWRRVKPVLAAALDLQADDRPAYLDDACAGDVALRSTVEALLAADRDAGDFLDAAPEPDAAAADDRLDLGLQVGPYVLERLIGRGGMGLVYAARRVDHEFERLVAVKMIGRGMDSAALIRRFRHERQILASLDHPHIARLFDGGSTGDGRPYFVMEYVDGVPIDQYADSHRLTTPERVRLCLQVIDAVHHAHGQLVVHRDLKPSNVLVTAAGEPKLLDFGIAKILDDGIAGDSTLTTLARPMTPDYASPEQVRGEAVSPATDVHALGLLLYEMLTGRRPYRLASYSSDEVRRVVCDQDAEPPSTAVGRPATQTRDGTTITVSPDAVSATRDGTPDRLRTRLRGGLDAIVLKALRKDPGDRYASAAALADDLRRYLDNRPVAAMRGAAWYRAGRFARRHRAGLATAAAVVIAIGATSLAAQWTMDRPGGPALTPAATEAPRRSVAVLRIRNSSGQPADAWLSTALAEMLSTELGGGGRLRVVPADLVAGAERELAAAGTTAATERGETFMPLRARLGVDLLVTGAFVAGAPGAARPVRLDLRVLRGNDEPIAIAAAGLEADLFAVVTEAGRALRRRLDLDEPSPDAGRATRAALPRSVDATRLYAEGLEHLRALDAVRAREHLEAAAAAEPGHPLIRMALASSWTALGYDARAEAEAGRAAALATGLNREQALQLEGQLEEVRKQWPAALEAYRTLWGFFADNGEYGLRLAAAQTAAGRPNEALETIAALRQLPPPQGTDPRVDLAEAAAASALGDAPRELASAERAVARARATGARQVLARARLAEGRSFYGQGRLQDAEQALQEAGRAFEAAGDRAGRAAVLNSLGTVADDQGGRPRAEALYQESFQVAESVGDRRGMSSALNNLGILLKDAGRLAEARQTHEQALALRREVGDRNWTAVSLSNIGVVLFEQDRLQDASAAYGEALTIAREIGDKRNIVRVLHNLGIVQRELGDLAGARRGLEEAIPVRDEIRDRRGGVAARVELGIVMLAQGNLADARRVQTEVAAISREISLAEGEAQATFQLGEIAFAVGDLAEAHRLHTEAEAMRRKLGQTRTVVESQLALATLALEAGRLDDAEALIRAVIAVAREQAAARLQAELLLARVRLAADDRPGARRAAAAARAVIARTERLVPRVTLELVEAAIELADGHAATARSRLADLWPTLAGKGFRLLELDTRLLEAEAARAAGDPGARQELEAVRQTAVTLGAGLVARKAQALLGS